MSSPKTPSNTPETICNPPTCDPPECDHPECDSPIDTTDRLTLKCTLPDSGSTSPKSNSSTEQDKAPPIVLPKLKRTPAQLEALKRGRAKLAEKRRQQKLQLEENKLQSIQESHFEDEDEYINYFSFCTIV